MAMAGSRHCIWGRLGRWGGQGMHDGSETNPRQPPQQVQQVSLGHGGEPTLHLEGRGGGEGHYSGILRVPLLEGEGGKTAAGEGGGLVQNTARRGPCQLTWVQKTVHHSSLLSLASSSEIALTTAAKPCGGHASVGGKATRMVRAVGWGDDGLWSDLATAAKPRNGVKVGG